MDNEAKIKLALDIEQTIQLQGLVDKIINILMSNKGNRTADYKINGISLLSILMKTHPLIAADINRLLEIASKEQQ